MEPLRLWRELRLKNLEAFIVRRGYYGDTLCWMLFVDTQRPSTLEDFPWLKGIEDEREFGRSNYIRVIILHEHPLEDECQREIVDLIGPLLEKGASDLHWSTFFEPLEPRDFADLGKARAIMLAALERVLLRHGVTIGLADIAEDRFNHLSQD